MTAVELLALPDLELFARADHSCRATFGPSVFLRGLLEVSNRCVRDCLYCGIRRSNSKVRRYSMGDDEIVAAVARGHEAGLRSFVLQGGEDPDFTPDRLARLASRLRQRLGEDSALVLSFGTMRKSDYQAIKSGGADRYLIRFETSDEDLHTRLRGSPLARRLSAIDDLKALGFEVGTGFMTGLPGSTEESLAADVALAASIGPDMIGIGPFIPHPGTPLGESEGRGLGPALRAVAALRLLLPEANMPATTAAGSVAPDGRERMLAAGANVLMPNIGPVDAKRDYELYPGKICLDEDGLSCIGCLSIRAMTVGKRLDRSRGDSPSFERRAALARSRESGPRAEIAGRHNAEAGRHNAEAGRHNAEAGRHNAEAVTHSPDCAQGA